jgi:hypothetical protein
MLFPGIHALVTSSLLLTYGEGIAEEAVLIHVLRLFLIRSCWCRCCTLGWAHDQHHQLDSSPYNPAHKLAHALPNAVKSSSNCYNCRHEAAARFKWIAESTKIFSTCSYIIISRLKNCTVECGVVFESKVRVCM